MSLFVRSQIWLYKTVLAQGGRLYYANAMVKAKATGRKNKKIILFSLVGFIILAGAGCAWYLWQQKQVADTKIVENKTKVEVEALNLAGDTDLATAYTVALRAKDVTKAQKLFADKISAEPDVDKKLALATQNVQLALELGNTDEALAAALNAVQIRSSHEVLLQVVTVYVAKHDRAQQAVYLQKAIDALEQSSDPKKDKMLAKYQARLAAVNKLIEESVRNGR
jgi:hypothetical protein